MDLPAEVEAYDENEEHVNPKRENKSTEKEISSDILTSKFNCLCINNNIR